MRIPIPYLCECFDADFETGVLTWRIRPLSHFPNERQRNAWNARLAGKRAGSINAKGYTNIQIKYLGTLYQETRHRLVWALKHGRWPIEVDHRHGVEAGDGIANLRESRGQNQHNRRTPTHAVSGYLGVYQNAKSGNWGARITVKGRAIWLGTFPTKEQAAKAYTDAKAVHHPFAEPKEEE